MSLLTPIKKFADAYDPAREAIVCAIEATIPALIATAIFLYFRKPFSSVFLYMPSYCLVLTFFSPTYKGKITILAVTFFVSGIGIFAVNALYNHIYTMMLVLLPILLFIFGSIKYKYTAALAPTLIAIAIALPSGWYQGVNRLIETFISFLICIFALILYELLFTKYRIRSHLGYISELINDLFVLYTSQDKTKAAKKIRYRHLFKKHSLYRTDIIPTKIFTDDSERFAYKVNLALVKAIPVVLHENHVFARNKFFAYGFIDVFTLYRRIFRNISLMMSFDMDINKLCKHVPLTDKLIENLRLRLQSQNRAIRKREIPNTSARNAELIEEWNCNLDSYLKNPPEDSDKTEAEYLLGLKYTVKDIDAVRAKLRKIRYGA